MKQAYTDPLMPGWSVKRAIAERVQYEDTIRWAKEDEQAFMPVPELPESREKPDKLALFRFMREITL